MKLVTVVAVSLLAGIAFAEDHGIVDSHVTANIPFYSHAISDASKLNVSSVALQAYVLENRPTIENLVKDGSISDNWVSAKVALVDGHDLITPNAQDCVLGQFGESLDNFRYQQIQDILQRNDRLPETQCTREVKRSLQEAVWWLQAREMKKLNSLAANGAGSVPKPANFSLDIDVAGGPCPDCGGFGPGPVPFAVNPAGRGYYGLGRFPLQPFATPLRPWGGITPIRQFLFGRGAIRRQNRRAFLLGY